MEVFVLAKASQQTFPTLLRYAPLRVGVAVMRFVPPPCPYD